MLEKDQQSSRIFEEIVDTRYLKKNVEILIKYIYCETVWLPA